MINNNSLKLVIKKIQAKGLHKGIINNNSFTLELVPDDKVEG